LLGKACGALRRGRAGTNVIVANEPTVDQSPATPGLEVVALGGLGEFGLNTMAISWGATTLLVDAGVMFPDPELLGVDLIIPDLGYLDQRNIRVSALVLTHGHEDHIGGVPHVMRLVDGPIYGTPLTLALLEPKLQEHGIDVRDRLVPVSPRTVVTVGELSIEFPGRHARRVARDPDARGHDRAHGRLLVDHADRRALRLHRFGQTAQASSALRTARASAARVTGRSSTVEAFRDLRSTRGRIVVTAFATSIYRVRILINLAARFGRKSRSSAAG
jgi:ribonuclease J